MQVRCGMQEREDQHQERGRCAPRTGSELPQVNVMLEAANFAHGLWPMGILSMLAGRKPSFKTRVKKGRPFNFTNSSL